jgi:hypothetical protein
VAAHLGVKCQHIMKKKHKNLFIRFGLILVAFVLIGTGAIPLFLKNDFFYSNWWGGLVFAPLTFLVGCIFLYLIILKWNKIEKM